MGNAVGQQAPEQAQCELSVHLRAAARDGEVDDVIRLLTKLTDVKGCTVNVHCLDETLDLQLADHQPS